MVILIPIRTITIMIKLGSKNDYIYINLLQIYFGMRGKGEP